jgi:hypothetical protein
MTSVDDILYFKKNISSLEKWDMTKPLFIQGPSGSGKSTLASLIFKERDISENTINSISIKKGRGTIQYIQDVLGKISVSIIYSMNYLNGIIIDDLDVIDHQDSIISQIFLIVKNNNNLKSPVIFVCNSMFISSNIQKIKSICYNIDVPKPSISRMLNSCNNLISNKSITICAEKSNGDWNYFNKLISISKTSDKLNDVDEKLVSFNIKSYLDYLLKKQFTLNDLFKKCEMEHNLLGLLCFTNIPIILKNNPSGLTSVYDNLCHFDIFEKKIDNDWSYQYPSILFGCIIPIYNAYKLNIKKYNTVYTHVFSISTSQINHRKLLQKVKKTINKSINIVSALLYHSLFNDIAYKKCKEMDLSAFTLNELQKIIITYYKPHKLTVHNKKILKSLL